LKDFFLDFKHVIFCMDELESIPHITRKVWMSTFQIN
jgi:hypothetical protein